jgi:hypothetical protein
MTSSGACSTSGASSRACWGLAAALGARIAPQAPAALDGSASFRAVSAYSAVKSTKRPVIINNDSIDQDSL